MDYSAPVAAFAAPPPPPAPPPAPAYPVAPAHPVAAQYASEAAVAPEPYPTVSAQVVPQQSTASKVWDGVEHVADAVTTVFAVVVGIGWVGFGILLFIAAGAGYGNFLSVLFGIAMIVYGIFLIMPTRGTKIIIY